MFKLISIYEPSAERQSTSDENNSNKLPSRFSSRAGLYSSRLLQGPVLEPRTTSSWARRPPTAHPLHRNRRDVNTWSGVISLLMRHRAKPTLMDDVAAGEHQCLYHPVRRCREIGGEPPP
jgi:hypothetical protein